MNFERRRSRRLYVRRKHLASTISILNERGFLLEKLDALLKSIGRNKLANRTTLDNCRRCVVSYDVGFVCRRATIKCYRAFALPRNWNPSRSVREHTAIEEIIYSCVRERKRTDNVIKRTQKIALDDAPVFECSSLRENSKIRAQKQRSTTHVFGGSTENAIRIGFLHRRAIRDAVHVRAKLVNRHSRGRQIDRKISFPRST